ncbi:hypothetical protein [Vacuolonema iberomarrocanum]|uniref:hypothetical protein n=1 Tax=Vacuolonema iberomarrocanum TaxID=3454632 RepID=UPI0019DC8B5F|nr:hypothetical protein [filamentous cyanobacterium LEGE 07170]
MRLSLISILHPAIAKRPPTADRAIAFPLLGLAGGTISTLVLALSTAPAQANLSDITGISPDLIYPDRIEVELAATAASLSEEISENYAACLSIWEQDDPITLVPEDRPCETLESLLEEARQFIQNADAQTLEELEAEVEQLQRQRVW